MFSFCACTRVPVCAYVPAEARGCHQVTSLIILHLISQQFLWLNLELMGLARSVSSWNPHLHFSCSDHRHAPHHHLHHHHHTAFFNVGTGT